MIPAEDNQIAMTGPPITRLTPEEFLERERAAEGKHEYWYGEVFPMGHGSPAHSLATANVQTALATLRSRPCYVFNCDLCVVVRWDELITYPDVTVLCVRRGSPVGVSAQI
jgi:Uma2 family endonuclease